MQIPFPFRIEVFGGATRKCNKARTAPRGTRVCMLLVYTTAESLREKQGIRPKSAMAAVSSCESFLLTFRKLLDVHIAIIAHVESHADLMQI